MLTIRCICAVEQGIPLEKINPTPPSRRKVGRNDKDGSMTRSLEFHVSNTFWTAVSHDLFVITEPRHPTPVILRPFEARFNSNESESSSIEFPHYMANDPNCNHEWNINLLF